MLLASGADQRVGIVVGAFHTQDRQPAFGRHLQAFGIQIGRQIGETQGRFAGRQFDLPCAGHLRSVEEQGHFRNFGFHFFGASGRCAGQQRQTQKKGDFHASLFGFTQR